MADSDTAAGRGDLAHDWTESERPNCERRLRRSSSDGYTNSGPSWATICLKGPGTASLAFGSARTGRPAA